MLGFKVIPITKHGQSALHTCMAEEQAELLRQNVQRKAIFKAFFHTTYAYDSMVDKHVYLFTLVEDIPSGMNFFIKLKVLQQQFLLDLPKYIAEVDKSMLDNGAQKDVDYYVEVYNG